MGKILDALTKAAAKYRRKTLAAALFESHGGVVQRGPYAGLKLGGVSNISKGPLALKLFGLYEPPVVGAIAARAPFTDLVNFGAADGYMSMGPLFAGLCQRSICFELTEEGRTAVANNAALNGLSDKVEIRGAVDAAVGSQLAELKVNPAEAVVLCDIEGAEFTALTSEVLAALKGATLIVELHDRVQTGKTEQRDALIARLPDGANAQIVASPALDFDGIEELEQMHDIDRALVLCEGRKTRGEWLIVTWNEKG